SDAAGRYQICRSEEGAVTNDLKKVLIRKIEEMNCLDRMDLLNKYASFAEDTYCNFSHDKINSVISKIVLYKFDRNALIAGLMKGEPIVDAPGCRLSDFLIAELDWI
ncbi:MAG: hypothetical protein WAK95_14925, partial [Desulfobacterales bacterium]